LYSRSTANKEAARHKFINYIWDQMIYSAWTLWQLHIN